MLTSTETPLARLQSILALLDYTCQHLPVDAATPFEQVLVVLDPDLEAEAAAHYVLQLFFAEDVMRASGMAELEQDQSATLQFMLELPVDCSQLSDARLLESFAALNLFTQLLPMGNLGLNAEKKVYFRYAAVAESQNMNAGLIADLIGMFRFFLTHFGPLLADFVNSEQSVSELMAQTGFHKAFEAS